MVDNSHANFKNFIKMTTAIEMYYIYISLYQEKHCNWAKNWKSYKIFSMKAWKLICWKIIFIDFSLTSRATPASTWKTLDGTLPRPTTANKSERQLAGLFQRRDEGSHDLLLVGRGNVHFLYPVAFYWFEIPNDIFDRIIIRIYKNQ